MRNVQQISRYAARMARVTVTVPDDVLETWRLAAQVQGQSLSGLIAEWMRELEPGLRGVVQLGLAMKQADESQREAIRAAVMDAAAVAEGPLGAARQDWESMVAEATNPHLSNRGVR